MPEPLQILFCWDQLGDETGELRQRIATETTDDGMFIRVLMAMRQWVSSSNRGIYQSLEPDMVNHFMSFESAMTRLKTLATADNAPELRKAATELLAVSQKPMPSRPRILESGWTLHFTPSNPAAKKAISFNADNTIGEGRNENEFKWLLEGNVLSIFRSSGDLQNRFQYDEKQDRFVFKPDPDARGNKDQVIFRG